MEMQSPDLAELAKALVKAQSEMESVKKGAENPFFKSKYADLASVREASMDVLNRNGLCIIQTMGNGDGKIKVITTLLHSSGQFVRGELGMVPTKNDPQSVGSVISYFRRYSWQAIIGLSAEDDDANSATQLQKSQTKQTKEQTKPKSNVQQAKPKTISADAQFLILCPENVGSKSGGPESKPWTRTYFKYQDEWYSTFDTTVGALLQEASSAGRQAKIAYKKGEKGNDVESVEFTEDAPPNREPGSDDEQV
jgi:hypothetical protein